MDLGLLFEFLLLGLLFAAGLLAIRYLARRHRGNGRYRAALAVAFLAGFLLFWANGAVGVIGASGNDVNMLYVAMLAAVLVASFALRFRPTPMAAVTLSAAALQVLIPATAIVFGIGTPRLTWQPDVAIITAVFTLLWWLSAQLFRASACRQRATG